MKDGSPSRFTLHQQPASAASVSRFPVVSSLKCSPKIILVLPTPGGIMHRSCLITPLLAVLSVAPLAGQSGPDRAAADSLLADLGRVGALDQLPPASRCEASRGTLRKLCKGLVALERGELDTTRDAAIAAEFELRQVVEEEPQWAMGWYGLGMARLQLARAGVIAKPAPLQSVGVSFEAGAGHALVRALEIDSTFAPALSALALAPIPREGASHLADRLAMLRRLRAGLRPLTLVGTAKVERVAGSRDSAVALYQRALQGGEVDSAVVQVELARDLHAAGQPREGREALIRGASVASPAGEAAYHAMLQWVAEPAELAEWDSLPVPERGDWMRRFWAKRDVAAGWPEGTRLVEHYRRVEYAWDNFTLFLPPSGRHKIAGYTPGIEDRAWEEIKASLGGARLDKDIFALLQVKTAEHPESADLVLRAQTGMAMVESLNQLGLTGPFRAFRTTQEELDDRGVVWIRYGKPDAQGQTAGGEALEAWRYDLPDGELVALFREEDFDGQSGASRLVPSLLDKPGYQRDQMCGISRRLCSLDDTSVEGRPLVAKVGRDATSALTDGGRLTRTAVEGDVAIGREEVARATTEDAHPRKFTAPLAPRVAIHGVSAAGGVRPEMLASFAIPGEQLQATRPAAANGRPVYPIRFTLAGIDAAGRRVELDTTRYFLVPRELEAGQYLSGTLELPVAAGTHDASLLVMQDDGRGAVASLPGVTVPGRVGGPSISSIVLGRKDSGVRWNSGTTTVALNPLNAFAADGEAELYYQVLGFAAGNTLATRVELFKADDAPADAKAALSLGFDERATGTLTEVQRTLALEHLAPGRYRVRVTVQGAAGSVSETAHLTIVKR